jgi:hypothetical protein
MRPAFLCALLGRTGDAAHLDVPCGRVFMSDSALVAGEAFDERAESCNLLDFRDLRIQQAKT